ncbi:MAG: ABC transporter substrate-binding protein [Chloroflexota bacterium]
MRELSFAIALLLAACGGTTAPSSAPPAQSSSPSAGGTVTIGLAGDMESGDPFLNSSIHGKSIALYMFDNLIEVAPDGKLVPGLAESWKVVDPKTITFSLRKGVKFQNGEDFNADAAKFSIDRMKDPATKSGVASKYASIDNVQVVDPNTIQLNLNKPDATLFFAFAAQLGMEPPAYVKQVGADGFAQKPVGTGPYKFVEWVRGDHITLEANTSYWAGSPKGKPAAQRLIFKPIPEESARVAALKSGQVQFIDHVSGDIASTLGSDTIAVVSKETTQLPQVHIDTRSGPTKDVRVRQALNYAVDVESIMKDILKTPGKRLNTSMSPSTIGYDQSLQPYTYDVNKAKQLLSDAGLAKGFQTKIDYPTTETKQIVEAIQAYLGAAGVNAEVTSMEIGAFNTNWRAQKDKMAPLAFVTYGAEVDPGNLGLFLTCQGLLSRYCNPQVDELWQKQLATYDEAQRADQMRQIAKLLHDDAGFIFMYPGVENYAMSKKLSGFTPSADGRIRLFTASVQG